MARVGLIQQEVLPAPLLVAATDPPDGGRVTFHAGGHGVDRFASGHGQHNAGMLDLEPSQVAGSGNRLEDGEIRGSDDQGVRFAATHRITSDAGVGLYLQHTADLNFLHYLRPGPLGGRQTVHPPLAARGYLLETVDDLAQVLRLYSVAELFQFLFTVPRTYVRA